MAKLTHTVSGNVASFRSADKTNIESLKVHFLPVQEGSGDPSPSNVRNISGWNEIEINKQKKNIGHIVGYSASSTSSPTSIKNITNNYGTTLNTTNFSLPDTDLIITQANYTETSNITHYRNGYIFIVLDNLIFNQIYDISFRISNIINNPLNATLNNLKLINPYGNQYSPSQIKDDVVIFKNILFRPNTNTPTVSGFDVRVCGMSFTLSEFMVTPTGMNDGIFEPYCGSIIPITFPTTGKNILNPADIIFYNNAFELDNGIYKNTATDTRSTIQLAVQLWKTTGTYIKTAYTLSYVVVGRNTITFTVDDPNCHYLCFKHNGIKKDFILLFPLPLGLHQYTISCDVLSNDPTTIGGAQITNIQLEVGDTATTYEAYHNDVDNTVYGGYVDIAKGEIVKEYDSYTFTGIEDDQLSYYSTSSTSGTERHTFRSTKLDRLPQNTSSLLTYYNMGTFPTNATTSTDITTYVGTPTYQIIFGIKSSLCDNTVESFSAWLSEHPLQIVYKLKNPIHYPLSKIELKTFLDQNNIWSNTNDITEVTYEIIDHLNQKRASIPKQKKKVLWNQWLPPLTSEAWQPYSTFSTVTFNDGIATSTWIDGTKIGYYTSIKDKSGTPQHSGEIWYASYMVNPSKSGLAWGIEMCGGVQLNCIENATANTWHQCSAIAEYRRGTKNYVYISNLKTTKGAEEGMTAQNKAPILINLTAMFGSGNEPTKEKFEALCKLNNVDLTKYHPQDTGTEQIWYVNDETHSTLTTVEWNQYAQTLISGNYKPQNSSYTTVTFEDNIMTRTATIDAETYRSSIITNYNIKWDTSHKYYFKQELYPSTREAYVLVFGGSWRKNTLIPANEWTTMEGIDVPNNNTNNGTLYLAYCGTTAATDSICKVRNPIMIDLTQMFGAGNEPSTPAELRAMCLKNNINLDEAQPYNTGTKMIWKV